jgi:hypothetical protein
MNSEAFGLSSGMVRDSIKKVSSGRRPGPIGRHGDAQLDQLKSAYNRARLHASGLIQYTRALSKI